MAEERPPRLVDYFVVAGLAGNGAPIPEETCVPEPSGPLRAPRPADPITDVAVIARALGEEVPQGYTCIQTSAGGHPLELSAGLLGGTQPVICYRRGRDKPPLVELGCVSLLCGHQGRRGESGAGLRAGGEQARDREQGEVDAPGPYVELGGGLVWLLASCGIWGRVLSPSGEGKEHRPTGWLRRLKEAIRTRDLARSL